MGLMNSLRGIIISLGTVAIMVLCFYLPFSSYAKQDTRLYHFLYTFTNRCTSAVSSLPFADILGKLLAGVCLAILGKLLMVLLDLLLKKCCKMVSTSAPTRMVDQILSCALYMVIGIAICLAIWFVLALMENFGLFNISEVLHENAHLSRGFFGIGRGLVQKLVGML